MPKALRIILSHRVPILTVLAILAYAVVVIRTAWMSDDAFITLRTVDNFTNGYGPRWNTIERVQAYTHPLWMLLLSGLYLLTHEPFYTTLFASILASVLTAIIVVQTLGWSRPISPVAVALFTVSKAFTDYSTSGLENPLSHLLLALFAWILLTREWRDSRKTVALFGVASLVASTRMDLFLMLAPALVLHSLRHRSVKNAALALFASTPFFAWEIFSLIYYGFPFPNTAYAKLDIGVPFAAIAQHGAEYAMNSLRWDPVTSISICLALALPPFAMRAEGSRNGGVLALAGGIALYLLYVCAIGGDFMSGRFFTAPMLFAVIALGFVLRDRPFDRSFAFAVFGLVALGALMPLSPIRSGRLYGDTEDRRGKPAVIDDHGIADERAFYYPRTGLLRIGLPPRKVLLYKESEGRKLGHKAPHTVVKGSIGFIGYFGGRSLDVVDYIGLTDPLLARLPSPPPKVFRPGHVRRSIPSGYPSSRLKGNARIADPKIRAYNDMLVEITRGELFTQKRWRLIAALNFESFFDLVEER